MPFVEEHGLAARYATTAETTIGWGIGGRAQGRLARGGRLALGGLHVDAPVLRLPVDNGGALAIRHVAGNIGGEILRRFVVTLDYARAASYTSGWRTRTRANRSRSIGRDCGSTGTRRARSSAR